jgi:hypothetical protein
MMIFSDHGEINLEKPSTNASKNELNYLNIIDVKKLSFLLLQSLSGKRKKKALFHSFPLISKNFVSLIV